MKLAMLTVTLAFTTAAFTVAQAGDNTPTMKVVREFHHAVGNGDKDKILSLIAELPGKDQLAEQLPFILEDKEQLAGAKPIEARISGPLAIVIVTREGQQYQFGVDIDPFCLIKVSGHWKVMPSITSFGAESDDAANEPRKQPDHIGELMTWYRDRKKAMYAAREKAGESPTQ